MIYSSKMNGLSLGGLNAKNMASRDVDDNYNFKILSIRRFVVILWEIQIKNEKYSPFHSIYINVSFFHSPRKSPFDL